MSDETPRAGPLRRGRPRRPTEPGLNIDLGLGELLGGLGNLLDLANRLGQEGSSEVSRTGEVQGPGGVRGVYGFTVKMGAGGVPSVERFGNVHATERGPEVSDVREPLVDVFDEGDHVLVVIELPGVSATDVKLDAKDDILVLAAEGRHRKYAKEILLPGPVDAASLRQSFQNGILEVRLNKATGSGD